MTYIIANTQAEGRNWALKYLRFDKKFQVLSTPNQIRGLAIMYNDFVYIITSDTEMTQTLTPALCGCRVTSCNSWIIRQREGVKLPLVKKAFARR